MTLRVASFVGWVGSQEFSRLVHNHYQVLTPSLQCLPHSPNVNLQYFPQQQELYREHGHPLAR